MKRNTQIVLLRHMAAFDHGNVDVVMADYASSAVLLTPEGTFRGHGQIRPVLVKLLKDIFSTCTEFKMIRQEVSGEVAFIVWSAESKKFRIPLATDTFVIRGGKIVAQTVVMMRERKR